MKYQLFFSLCFLSAGIIQAQQSLSFQCQFNHMAFPVKDLQASVAFYRQVLNLPEITNRTQNPSIRWLSLGGDKELHLISGIKEPVQINKALHLALSTEKIEDLVGNLINKGIAYSNWEGTQNTISIRPDGVKQLYFQDPDGYWIEVNNGYTVPSTVSSIKDEVWKLEENYWMYVKNKDYKKYLELWDENFKGYPSTNIIGGKANITDWMKEMYAKNEGKIFDYALKRMEENVFGDIVIVLYDASVFWKNDKGEILGSTTYKLTHTWKKNPEGWQIIGGMGGIK
jgi:catechol 2,3-dioxygenase-like lactoylglutathione lyase family enzyme/ketosteroid isomerase-like protein